MDRKPDVDELFSLTYDQLRRIAAQVGRGRTEATLNPTALVNEAYLRLAPALRAVPESQLQFKRIAARAMRQVVVEAIRRKNAGKRGGGVRLQTLDEDLIGGGSAGEVDLLALDAALESFRRRYPRQAMMVEYRFFGGYDVAETARLLGVSEATVARDWRVARAWFSAALNSHAPEAHDGGG